MFNVITRSAARRTPALVRCASQARPPRTPENGNTSAGAEAETTGSASKSEDVKPTGDSVPPASTAESSTSVPTEELKKPLPSLDISPLAVGEEEPQRTGAKSSRDNVTSAEKQRRMASRITMALATLGFGLNVAYMGRDWEDSELADKKWKREDAPNTRWLRTKERFTDIFDYFNKPSFPELLPPPMPAPHQKPYTLVISLDDLLITSTWDRQHGWRTAKRPGVDYFLGYISQFYEVVLFTTQNQYTAAPIVESLDRYNFYITYKVFRDGTRSLNGEVVKDLSYLNRDLSKVVVLDTVPEHVQTHPENAIIIPKWKGDPKDRGLIAMIPFLESIGIYKPQDVRPILQHYQGKNIPLEYAKTEAAAKAKHIEEWKAKHHAPSASSLSVTGLFGGSTTPKAPTHSNIPPTFLEQKRFEAQEQFKEEQAWIAKNKDYLENLRKQDEQAAQAAMPNNIWEAFDQMAGKPPPNKPGAEAEALPPTSSTSTPSQQ